MNLLDKVIQEWSVKTDKGYPDILSKEDMDLFESMFGFKLVKEVLAEEYNYAGNCVTGLDDPYFQRNVCYDATEMAGIVDEFSNEFIQADEFVKKVNWPSDQLGPAEDTIYDFAYNKYKDIYWAYHIDNDVHLFFVKDVISEAKNPNDYNEDTDLFESMSGFRLDENTSEPDIVQELRRHLDSQKVKEITERPLYQSATVEEFIKSPKKYINQFIDLFDLYKKNVSGKGELIPLAAIKDAKTGGNLEKDVIGPNGKVIEVKDLVTGNKFSLGSFSNPRRSKFGEHLEVFMKQLKIYDIDGKYRSFIEYYEDQWFKGGYSGKALKETYRIAKQLKDKTTSINYIKIGGIHYAIQPNKEYTLKIDTEGQPVADLPKAEDYKIASTKLKNHPWVIDPNKIEEDLLDLRNAALKGIDYFLLYQNKEPIIISKSEFDKYLKPYRIALSSLHVVLSQN